MTAKQKAYRASLLRQIHTTLRYRHTFAGDRELWEDTLRQHYGVTTSADLSIDDLRSLLGWLRGEREAPQAATISEAQLSFLLAQWQERSRHKGTLSLMRFASRILRRDVRDLESLRRGEAGKLIAAVKGLKPMAAVNNREYRG